MDRCNGRKVDPSLISVGDVNGDGIVQFGEIRLGADIIMLATPEIGGLPYVVSGLVAAGGLAAALSTADGLLLTISNAMVRDVYCHEISHHVTPEQRVILSKFALLAVALVAAMVASLKPADILPLVSASFSLAASAFVPAMVLGIFWRGATRAGAVAGMLAGLGVTVYYMLVNAPVGARGCWACRPSRSCGSASSRLSAGVFGVAAGAAGDVAVSLAGRRRAEAGGRLNQPGRWACMSAVKAARRLRARGRWRTMASARCATAAASPGRCAPLRCAGTRSRRSGPSRSVRRAHRGALSLREGGLVRRRRCRSGAGAGAGGCRRRSAAARSIMPMSSSCCSSCSVVAQRLATAWPVRRTLRLPSIEDQQGAQPAGVRAVSRRAMASVPLADFR